MTVPEPTYISPAEVKEQTSLTALDSLSDADLKLLIQTAEDQIDAYCGPQRHHWDDLNTDRVFPREFDQDGDGNPLVPYKVSRACLRQVEHLFLQWWSTRATTDLPTEHAIESESIGGDGSYSHTLASGGMDFSAATISEQAKALLRGFVSRSAGIDVSDPGYATPSR